MSILDVGLLPSRQVNAGSFTAQYRYIYWLFSPDCGLQDYCIQYVSVVQKGCHTTFNKINLSLFVSDVYEIQNNFPNNIPTMWAYNILLTAKLLTMYVTAQAQTQYPVYFTPARSNIPWLDCPVSNA